MTQKIARRELVLGGLLTVFHGSCAHSHAQTTGGCWISGSHASTLLDRAGPSVAFESGREVLEPRSGDQILDRALARSLATLTSEFGVLPAFCYYMEPDSPNAGATSERRLDRADGTVMFGLKLLGELMQRPRPDAAIIAVCAHEYGHIVSYKNGMISTLNPNRFEPFRGEQFADFMAGFFAGRRKLQYPDFPAAAFASTQHSFGGGDHGTRSQRGEAVQAGFLAAYQQRLDPESGKQAAFQYAMSKTLAY